MLKQCQARDESHVDGPLQATAEGPEVRKKARNFIARNMKQASMVASGYVIGHFLSFAGLRATRKHAAVPVQGMLYATVRPCLMSLLF